ncbi:MAG: sigma-70 family RNA polymerase sigma factor [Planctomycetota bacterium]|nr:sigma-70 family RNA polymerase sigma factor [Planctomycetota bacterium]
MSTPAGGALPPDLMLAHAGSIRALAMSILGDEHAAEDVLQETWLRALKKPPPRQDSIGGWLRRVAEGIAISRLRSEGRRRNRETHWVEDRDCAHSSYDATERAEVLRAVVDEVLALDEPYREAVMRRYFEGMPPREIAVATDATVATVNSRIQRAQAKLRERLDRRLSDRCGGMRGALLALVGWPEEAVAVATTGLFTKALAWKLAAGVVGAGAVVALALWSGGDAERAIQPELREVASATDARTPARGLADAGAAAAARTQVAPTTAVAPIEIGVPLEKPTPGNHAFELCIEPIDAKGIAVADCRVWLGPEPGPLALVGSTGWDGALRLTWRGDEAEVAFVVRAARAGSGSTPLRRVRVRAGSERVVRLALDGARGADGEVPVLGDLPLVSNMVSPRPRRDEGRFLLDSAGNGLFQDPWLLVGPEAASAAPSFAALEPIVPATPFGVAAGWSADGPRAGIEVRVVDGAGRPVVQAPVVFRAAVGGYTEITATGANGIATTAAAPPGATLVTVGAPGTQFPAVTRRFETTPGATRTVEILQPFAESARIRLVGAKGEARAGWLYELRDDDGSTLARGQFDGEGRAVVPIPGGSPVRFLARADATGPAVVVDPALIARGVEQTIFAAFDPHVRSLRVVVRGAGVSNAVVRVTRVDSGDALDAAPVDDVEPGEEGALAFRVRGLSNGSYRVAVGSPTRGWFDGGEHEITGGRGAEVVYVELDAAARLEIANGDATRLRLVGHRAGMRIVSPDVLAAEGQKLPAAPGEFDLLVERPQRAPTLRPQKLEPGSTARVE